VRVDAIKHIVLMAVAILDYNKIFRAVKVWGFKILS